MRSVAAPLALLAAASVGAHVPAQAPEPPATAPAAKAADAPQAPADARLARMLSGAWLADLYPFARDPDISDEGYEASMSLALRCARMAPDRRSAWDLVLLLADQVEAGSPGPARAARREALAALTRIDPSDDVVRLARIADAIDQLPTADARVRAFETMLGPQNREAIGAPAAARLAYQLASLESRIGNTELYARWLGESVKADPSYATAAQAAAGFFRMRVEDPTADVELLSVAVEANPRDIATWSALISILLDGGAFEAAERAARLAIVVADAERRKETVYSLTGDLATALWGRGQREAAVRELQSRMDALTDDFRRIISMMDPSLTLERLNREYPPLPSSLSIAMIGLAMNGGDAKRVDELVDRAVRGTDAEIDRAKTRNDPPRTIGGLDVQKATILLLFGKDVRAVPALIDGAEKSGALGEDGKARYSAMLLWRQGKLDEAIAALQPLAGDDPLAGYALANALAEAKRVPEAAQRFKSVAEQCIGTSIGLLALDRLAETLKQPVILTSQLSPAIGDRAKALDKALELHLRRSLDEIVENPMRALTVEMRASASTVQAYEPFSFEVRLRNNSRLPLAIGADSPIGGRMTLRAAAPKPGTEQLMELPVTPILIDRRLRLSPGEELKVSVDSDLTAIGLLLNVEPLEPHILDLALVSNPSQATAGLSPGFMGTVTTCAPVQFAGVAVTEGWVKETVALLKGPGGADAAKRLALLVHAASDPKRLPEPMRGTEKELWSDIVAAWKAQPAEAQAWVIGVMPQDTPAMAPLLEAIRSSTSPDVLRSWCITRVTDPKDPVLDVCRRSGDAELAALADAVAWVAERRAARAVEEMGIQAERARTGGTRP